jgi:hypothetical protein
MRLSREVNPGPPALQANTLCKEPFDSVIQRYSEHQIVLLQHYSFYAYENTLKVYYCSRRIRKKYLIVFGRQKSLTVHGDYGDFTVVLYRQRRHSIRQKYFSVHGE